MSRDNNNGAGSVMLAFVVGALTGAAVALLFAPATGEETRDYLGQKAREGRDKARDAVDHEPRVLPAASRNRGHRDRPRPRRLPAGCGSEATRRERSRGAVPGRHRARRCW